MKLSEALVKVATDEIGVTEVAGSNCGPRVDQYKAATWMDNPKQGFAWCASFVCWCMREALVVAGVHETSTFKRPQTASAWDFINWSKKQDDSTATATTVRSNMIQTGDIVVYQFSHIGIAVSACKNNGDFYAVEGNTDQAGSREGGGVYKKLRNASQVRARIRLMV